LIEIFIQEGDSRGVHILAQIDVFFLP